MKPNPPNKISEYGALLIIATLFLLVVIIVTTSGWFGCGISADLETRVGTVETAIGEVETRIGTVELRSGRDTNVNEPVTGWILALGYIATSIALIIAYTLMHRSRLFRVAKDKIRGKP